MKAWEATIRKTQAAKRRANSIFGGVTAPHEEDDDNASANDTSSNASSTTEAYRYDKVLFNGDYYAGHWCDNTPHGQGKYLWTDGCMYVGEWSKGKMNGKGKFCWPTGAMFEGDFKSGHMDGPGVFTGHNGDSYAGQWVMNLKHGSGVKSFVNGDVYDGQWHRGMREGDGKYHWKDGSTYDGEWKSGVMCGSGTFTWANGNRYEGQWQGGVPEGKGTYTWPDGSFYQGNWSKDASERNGTYYPSNSSSDADQEWDQQEVYEVLSSDYPIYSSDKVSILPSQKKIAVGNATKADVVEKPRRMSVDGRVYMGVDRINMWEGGHDGSSHHSYRKSMEAEVLGLTDDGIPKGAPMRVQTVVKKQGETITKNHKSYDLMLKLQLGIRHSVGRPAPVASLDLKASAFDPKEKVWTRFPPEGSKHTPPHPTSEFKWKDYCPVVFRTLRKLFQVDPADYMISICGDDALRELSSPGKSGSFFYLTNDDRYMIKTIKKAEVKVLIRMLSAYYNHVRSFANTLIIRFFGLHCVKLTGSVQKKVRFIIMGNLLRSKCIIHRRFDLKGSSLGRSTHKPEAEMIDANTIFKDLDLNFLFILQKAWFHEFCRQVDKDCEFLEQERIMDYSLLVGLHFRDVSGEGDPIPCETKTPTGKTEGGESSPRMRLGVNMPARVERTVRRFEEGVLQLVGEATGDIYEVVMFFGIIDILQDYDINKKLEHAYKSMHYDPTSISAVDPKQYARRFRDFILQVFCEKA